MLNIQSVSKMLIPHTAVISVGQTAQRLAVNSPKANVTSDDVEKHTYLKLDFSYSPIYVEGNFCRKVVRS